MHPPVLVRAMVLARDILFVSGPPDVVDEKMTWGRSNEREVHARLAEQAAALEGKKGGMLYAVSATDGERIREIKLDCVPVFDGMAAAGGRLYISAMDGSVVCYAGK